MTTTAAEDRVRDAWEGYRIACADVDQTEYPETEEIAWELLQHELKSIAGGEASAVRG